MLIKCNIEIKHDIDICAFNHNDDHIIICNCIESHKKFGLQTSILLNNINSIDSSVIFDPYEYICSTKSTYRVTNLESPLKCTAFNLMQS